jgi:superfamily II DNA helicase RecQ
MPPFSPGGTPGQGCSLFFKGFMSLHCFFVPARQPDPAQVELNAFLAAQRVLAVQREWLADGAHSGWAFCVEVLTGPGPLPAALKAGAPRRNADVDYKQVLSEADFLVFARLREWRKGVAQADGVPVYAVFSNEQLSTCVTKSVRSLAALSEVEGVGTARVAKYGPALLQALADAESHAHPESPAPQPAGWP